LGEFVLEIFFINQLQQEAVMPQDSLQLQLQQV
ncbi:unnamed protein product, partial [marine sediment metagenome]